ncbi:MAG: hypothetical protein ACFFCS_04365 [Candidatus Hodarchaeota archaeon]
MSKDNGNRSREQGGKISRLMGSTVRSKSRTRIVFETIAKMTILGGIIFNLGAHLYALILLQVNGLLPELIGSMTILDLMLIGGGLAFIIIVEVTKRGPMLEWFAYFAGALLAAALVVWQMEYFDPFTDYGFTFMLIPNIFVVTWIALTLVSLGYLLVSGPVLLVTSIKKKSLLNLRSSTMHKVRTAILVALPLLSMGFAVPAMNLYIAEGTVKRTVSYTDTNTDATLSVWNDLHISAQVGSTDEIDLGLLSVDENRTLTAFGKMNTTFFHRILFGNPTQENQTIAYLKMLDAFNCTVCGTIWYSPNVSQYIRDVTGDDSSFPGPHFADDWIGNARATLEFVVNNNIPNVIGICADSEASYIGDTVEGYWEEINKYDAFLQEVQTNASLMNPRPGQDHFETVLCTGPRGVMDMIDGDMDVYTNRRLLGFPPGSWTKYHFMLYRGPPDANPSVLYDYLLLMKRFIGVENAVPIVGLAGSTWFSEGYFEGTANNFGWNPQQYEYDGIDGWEAMKREILIGKAMGFDTVSVFKLYSSHNISIWEDGGFLDNYTIDNLEELADEWNQEKTVEYPISSLPIRLSTRGLFSPHDELVYDLINNVEMQVVQVAIFCLIIVMVIWNLKRNRDKLKPK